MALHELHRMLLNAMLSHLVLGLLHLLSSPQAALNRKLNEQLRTEVLDGHARKSCWFVNRVVWRILGKTKSIWAPAKYTFRGGPKSSQRWDAQRWDCVMSQRWDSQIPTLLTTHRNRRPKVTRNSKKEETQINNKHTWKETAKTKTLHPQFVERFTDAIALIQAYVEGFPDAITLHQNLKRSYSPPSEDLPFCCHKAVDLWKLARLQRQACNFTDCFVMPQVLWSVQTSKLTSQVDCFPKVICEGARRRF